MFLTRLSCPACEGTRRGRVFLYSASGVAYVVVWHMQRCGADETFQCGNDRTLFTTCHTQFLVAFTGLDYLNTFTTFIAFSFGVSEIGRAADSASVRGSEDSIPKRQ